MNHPKHIFVNSLISIPLKYTLVWDWPTVLIFVIMGGFLIDVDHILFFVFKNRTINPKKLLLAGKKMRSRMQPGLYIFHSPEFNIALLSYSFFNTTALVIFLSNLSHLILDTIEHYRYHHNLAWMKIWSVGYYLTH